ncbi:hypothetical protein N9948_02040 [bacterium]|nr:hypothetical protein [bacterium]
MYRQVRYIITKGKKKFYAEDEKELGHLVHSLMHKIKGNKLIVKQKTMGIKVTTKLMTTLEYQDFLRKKFPDTSRKKYALMT